MDSACNFADSNTIEGKIIKGIGGFYYIETADGVYECKARGVFRKEHKKPLVGDDVLIEITDREAMLGSITELLPRRNELLRPAVANVDQALVIFAVASPAPPLNLIDRMLILLEQQGLPCALVFNKSDLDDLGEGKRFREIYESAGYTVYIVSASMQADLLSKKTSPKVIEDAAGGSLAEGASEYEPGNDYERLLEYLKGKTTTVSGPSGVGKSSLINLIAGREVMQTGEISEKIDRGKHTTRHSELFAIGEDAFICDTPGFSSLELYMAGIEKEDLWKCYPEFIPEEPFCKFAGCSHVSEPENKCGIKIAVKDGRIQAQRYENYCKLYEGLKARRKY